MLEKIKSLFAKKENIYLTLSLIFGLIMAVFNPPFAGVPDEPAHFYKSWSVAEGNLRCANEDSIPKSAQELPDKIKPVSYEGAGKKFVVANFKNLLFSQEGNDKTIIGGVICSTTPIGYLPQALGLRLGSAFGFSALGDFYLARIFNLLVAVFLTYLAIKIIPFGKIVLLLIALLPMTIQQFASLGYDGLHISLIFLLIAFVLKLAVSEEKISSREIFTLVLLSLLALNIKQGFFALFLLVLLIPISNYRSRKAYWFSVASVIFFNLFAFFVVRSVFQDFNVPPSGVNMSEQMKFVLFHPINFLNVVFETLYRNFSFFLESFFFKPGWLKSSLPHLWYVFMIFGSIFLLRNEEEKVNLTKGQRILMFLIFIASLLFVFLSMYLFWTKVGANSVKGVQGRYLLSLMPLLIFTFYKSKFNFKLEFIKKYINVFILIFSLVSFIFAFFALNKMYYDKSPKEKSTFEQYKSKIK
jgi:uncharacterized membrane protein